MKNDQLLQDIERYALDTETSETLRAAKIETYSQLFAVVADERADETLREKACWALWTLSRRPTRYTPVAQRKAWGDFKGVDRRKAIPPLLKALQSQSDDVCLAAARTLGFIDSQRAISPMLAIAKDRTRRPFLRDQVINSLGLLSDEHVRESLRSMALDKTEHILVRSSAIEWNHDFHPAAYMDDYLTLLADESADVRFWAAYRFSQDWGDITAGLAALDQIAAFDHTLPKYWGWHVDREALEGLGMIYYRLLVAPEPDEDGDYHRGHTHLISGAVEYTGFDWRYRRWQDDHRYVTDEPPPPTLRIESTWLAAQLERDWPGIQLGMWQPQPQTYILNWIVSIDDEILIGGLHHDGYAVAVTSHRDSTAYQLAAWYRSIIPAEEKLYLHEWADVDVPLNSGMTATDIENAHNKRSRGALDYREEVKQE